MRKSVRVAALCAACLFAGAGGAQDWPQKPVHFIVAFAPGGPADIIARLVGNKLAENFGQQVVVENRGGAGGNIGAVAVAKSVPDGYTALVTTSAFAVNVSLFANPGYNAERDFIPVVAPASQPNMIVVHPGVRATTLGEFIALSRGRKLAFASPGAGTTPHLTGEYLLRVLAGLDIAAVHFRGAGPAVAAVVGGEPDVGSMAIAAPLPQVKAGRLRALAVSSAKRIAALPDVPTLAEAGYPGVEDYTWVGIFLPAGTPAAIVQKLNEAINRAIETPEVRERLEALAFDPLGGPQPRFSDYVRAETVKWGRVVREANIRIE